MDGVGQVFGAQAFGVGGLDLVAQLGRRVTPRLGPLRPGLEAGEVRVQRAAPGGVRHPLAFQMPDSVRTKSLPLRRVWNSLLAWPAHSQTPTP